MGTLGSWEHIFFPTRNNGPPNGHGRLVDVDVDIIPDEHDLGMGVSAYVRRR